MITKTALIAALIVGTASVAMATEYDPSQSHRYPGSATTSARVLEGRNVALPAGRAVITAPQYDRASSPNAVGF